MIGMFLGSSIGGYIPILFGARMLSFSSILFSAIGGIIGIYIAYKFSENI